jgi:Ser/Thr protein kinase RdoA (MazF antagonist)
MMKLRNLFNNLDLAAMLVKNWDYDPQSLDLFQYFRISANAIYPFKVNGEVCFLRCCPAEEKSKASILAELEFIGYLRGEGYPALEPLPAKTGKALVVKATPWGEYYASVFKRVTGQTVEESSYADEIMRAYGAALGQLHALSTAYRAPKVRRWSHLDVFDWIEQTLTGLGDEPLALDELRLITGAFAELSIHPGNYGLIHYDFELDNVYYDALSPSCSVIDFDDAMYHWYLMDVLNALVSLKIEIPEGEYASKKAIFLDGYRSKFELDENLWAAAPLFIRFANLYGYTRNARALQERWENEPEWMVELRAKLT